MPLVSLLCLECSHVYPLKNILTVFFIGHLGIFSGHLIDTQTVQRLASQMPRDFEIIQWYSSFLSSTKFSV